MKLMNSLINKLFDAYYTNNISDLFMILPLFNTRPHKEKRYTKAILLNLAIYSKEIDHATINKIGHINRKIGNFNLNDYFEIKSIINEFNQSNNVKNPFLL